MRLSKAIILTLLLVEARCSLLNSLESSYNISFTPQRMSVKMKLVTDIIANRNDENIVLIANLPDIADFSRLDIGTTYVTLLEPKSITDQTIRDLTILHLKDNKPCFYIALVDSSDTEDGISGLLSTIKDVDHDARVAVIYDHSVDVKDQYENRHLYNIYIFNPNHALTDDDMTEDKKEIVYKMHSICRFCSNGIDTLMLTNKWGYSYGFQEEVTFPLSFSGNFHKASVSMAVYENFRPNFYIIGKDENGNHIYDGLNYELYVVMGKMLNLTWEFIPRRSLIPLIKDLHEGKIDIFGSGLRLTFAIYNLLGTGSTPYVYTGGKNIVSVEPSIGISTDAIFKAFDVSTWALVFLFIPFSGFALYAGRKFSQNHDNK